MHKLKILLGGLTAWCLILIAKVSAQTLDPQTQAWPPGVRPPIVMKQVFAQMDLLNCKYDPPPHFDPPELLRKLYGRHFNASQSGHGNIVVLGTHNSGTSMVTRIIMLLGAFAGNFETISIHRHNKLKYYEQFPMAYFHDAFLAKFVDSRFRPYHAQGLNFTTMTEADYQQVQCFGRKLVANMGRHAPWVLKDPRMALTMPLWKPLIPQLVCVMVVKDPVKNAMSLAANAKKSSLALDSELMTTQRWLSLWRDSAVYGLEGCRGAPTILIDSRHVATDVDGALRRLKVRLERAGARGLVLPDADEVQRELKDQVRSGSREYRISKAMQERTGLSDHPETDVTMPQLTAEQAALAQAFQHHLQQIDANGTDLRAVAGNILSLAATLKSQHQADNVDGASQQTASSAAGHTDHESEHRAQQESASAQQASSHSSGTDGIVWHPQY